MGLPPRMKICVAIATAGRRDVLTENVNFIARQTRPPDEFFVCPANADDADVVALSRIVPDLQIVSGAVGSSHQRNAMMRKSAADVIVFFDDDFMPALDFLAEIERIFSQNDDVVLVTGDVLADGAQGAGLDFPEGHRILDAAGFNDVAEGLRPIFNGYGCNMAARLSVVREKAIVFDENLPLYAWLEDVDFSRQLAPYGRIVKSRRLRGVHLGTKLAGRTSGRRLGYSQIANRVYLMNKGNIPLRGVLEGSLRNLFSNVVKSIYPEPWIDRRGRLLGNILALRDLVRGRLDPANILKM